MITIVDYGMGNLGSILNMFRRIGKEACIARSPEEVAGAERILLPGVGAFDAAMERIDAAGFRDVLNEKALNERVPVLGICLGMQLLTRGSEEGHLPGLGWIPAATRRFPPAPRLKVPHMGWNVVERTRPSALTAGFEGEVRFYFVHSYYVEADAAENVIMETGHGVRFASGVQSGNIYGAQFHPEKSHRFGMHLLRNFAEL
jgi:glutamine amidotransferase